MCPSECRAGSFVHTGLSWPPPLLTSTTRSYSKA
ncbi:hypothetical protein LEMLEM_LOCUS13998 [Lemmus lemmus]